MLRKQCKTLGGYFFAAPCRWTAAYMSTQGVLLVSVLLCANHLNWAVLKYEHKLYDLWLAAFVTIVEGCCIWSLDHYCKLIKILIAWLLIWKIRRFRCYFDKFLVYCFITLTLQYIRNFCVSALHWIVCAQSAGSRCVHTVSVCSATRRQTCVVTSGCTKASNLSSVLRAATRAVHAVTFRLTCCATRPINRSCVTAAASHTSRGPLCDGTNVATLTDASSNATSMHDFWYSHVLFTESNVRL